VQLVECAAYPLSGGALLDVIEAAAMELRSRTVTSTLDMGQALSEIAGGCL